MKPKIGDIFKSKFNGVTFIIEKIVNQMAVLKSKDGRRRTLTGLSNLKLFYHKEVPEMDRGVERRQNPRYLVKGNPIASLHNGKEKIGKVKDISMGGLSFEHIEPVDEEESNQESLGRNLYLSMDEFSLSRVPCTMIYDTPVHPSSEYQVFPIDFETRRCGVEFQTLLDDQKMQVQFFLRKCTKGILPSSED